MKRKQLKFMKCGRNNDNFANFSYKLQDFQNIETNHRVDIDGIKNRRQAGKNGVVCVRFLYIYPSFRLFM